jgi:multidrug efflux pump subunit AcrB
MIAGLLKYYRVSILAVAALLCNGIWTCVVLPRTEDPEFDTADCRVVTLWPGVSAGKIENLVTRPLEEAIDELDHIQWIQSLSAEGLSQVDVHFEATGVPEDVIEEIKQKVKDAGVALPEGVGAPTVYAFNTSGIPIVIAALAGPDDYNLLHDWAEMLENELASIKPVSIVEIEGMPQRQILVLVDNDRLSQYRIPLTRIRDIVRLENAAVPGGKLDVGLRRFLLKSPNEYTSIEEIGETVIGNIDDSVVLLRDVADVVDGFEDVTYLVRTNRRPTLLVTVNKKEKTNTIAVAQEIRSKIEEFRTKLPEGIDITLVSDRGQNVDELLSGLKWNAIGGGLIVVIMVSLVLGLRQALVVSISIPLSILITFTLMDGLSIDLHQVSICGLVLALGMLVDSALVIVENIARHLEEGKPLFSAVVSGVEQVKLAVLSSALTTVAAFIPLLFLSGTIGAFIYSLPMTVIFSLMGSVVVALTVVPLLCYAMWKSFPMAKQVEPGESRASGFYLEIAKTALRNRFVTLVLALCALAVSVAAIPRLGVQFFPKAEKRFFLINVRLPRGVSFETTRLVTAQVEEMLSQEAAIRDFTANIGKGTPRIYYNEVRENEDVGFAQFLVNLREDFSGPVEDYIGELQTKLRQISGATIEPKALEQGPGTGAAIQIRVSGDNLDTLAGLALEIRQRIEDVPGVTDLRDTLGQKAPRLVLDFDKQKAALLGVDSFTFSSTVFMALNGQTASYYRDREDEIPIVVRLDKESIQEVSDLNRLYLPSQFGSMVPFSEAATVVEEDDFLRIVRRNRRRLVVVECDAGNRLANDVLGDIQARLADLALPSGYGLEYGGENEERNESFSGLGQALVLACLLIYGILAVQFNSFIQPFVILFTVPFGVIGAVVGLFVTGNPFGFMAFIGIVSLTGIIINDSIVLTDYANYLQRVEGKGMYQSLLEAGRTRFRPVILTSITTIGGMTPLAIWGGSLWSPLASALIFGLAVSTVLILVILPVIYSILVRNKERHRAHQLGPRIWRRLFSREQ